MSGSHNRHSLASFFSSKTLGKRWRLRLATVGRTSKRRSLRLESLERRELMANDVAAIRHNSLVPTDVNGDFDISPVDALQVINALNRQSRGALTADSASASMYDVNNDGSLSPIDALVVINRLKTGEGVGELAAVDVQILNSSGTVLTPKAGTSEYTIAPGALFTVRTRARDLRSSATGVFSTYTDINYATQGSATTELAQVLWSEVQTLSFSKGTNGGNFTLTYGSESTNAITFSTSASANRTAIANAIGALSFVGGASNLRVTSINENATDGQFYDVFFVGSKVRTDVPNPVVGTNNLTSSGASNVLTVSAVSDPANKLSLSAAISFPANPITPTSSLVYNGGASEATFQTIGTTGLRINDAGNFANATQAPSLDDPSAFLSIFDTAFRASSTPGKVDFAVGSSQNTRLGIGLFENDTILADSAVSYPAPFSIVIATDLQAIADTFNVLEGSAATTLDVLANDFKKDGTTFTITAVTQPTTGGTVSIINGGAAVSFTPSAGFSGNPNFTYTITNNLAATSTATVTVNVNPLNKTPVALGTPLTATEDGPAVSFTAAQLYSPGAGEDTQTVSLSNVALVAGQTGGSVSIVSGNVSFTPAADFFGSVLFTVTGTDTGTPPASTTATFTINVAPVNDAPVATGTSFATDEDTNRTILASDMFSPGPNETTQTVSLGSATAVAGQTGGTIAVVGGNAVFTPTANFSGTFVFVAVAQDNASPSLQSAPSTLTITVSPVNDAPTAVADTGAANFTVQGLPTPFELDVMRNDTAGPLEPTDTIRISAVGAVTGAGTVSIKSDGSRVLYTPGSTSIGNTESFTYTITDGGGLTSTATAEVVVVAPTLPFAVNDSTTVAEDSVQTTINVLLNDIVHTGSTKRLISIGTLSPTFGSIAILNNGTPADTSDDTVGFTPAANFNGSASFTYVMNDSATGSENATGTVNVTVTEVNDAPTVANSAASTNEDTAVTILSTTILTGSTKGPANESTQTLTIVTANVLTSGAGTAVVTNGNVVFTPTDNANGTVLISYTATDDGKTNGAADPLSATRTITVTVNAVNDAPIANNDSGTTAEGVPLTLTGTNILLNDRPGPSTAVDEANQTLSLVSVVMVSGSVGTVALSGGNVVFTPPAFFNGTSSATYVIQDSGTGNPQATGTITFNVTAVNNAPVPVAATRSANATIATDINLTTELAQASRGGGADEASQTVRINRAIALSSTRGTVSLNSDGTIRYVAPAGFTGQDTFDYEIIDNGTTNGNADPRTGMARVTVNVTAFQLSTISGQVWIDDDRDSSIDSDELKLGGSIITLTGRASGATTDITPIRQTTASNGRYSFSSLVPGNYVVSFTPPSNLVDAPAPNSVSHVIPATGGMNFVSDFSVYGMEAGYHSILENAESGFYQKNGQRWRDLGITALVRTDGTTAWYTNHGGFDVYKSETVRVTSEGVFLTIVLSNNDILESKVSRNMYVSAKDSAGNTFVRIFATPAELTFQKIGTASGEGEGNTAHVDLVFAEMGR